MRLKGMIICFISFCVINFMNAQGSVVFQRNIPDNTTSQFFIEVSGAVENQLGVNGQGLCKVNIKFTHPHLSDLKVKLISPAGQSIILVADQGSGYETAGSLFDVSFVKCSDSPAPDLGILPKWSNRSNWLKNTVYTGSYHPFAGNCLEQINTGSVNGLWQLQVNDGFDLDVGNLDKIELIFCIPSGVNCSGCYKTAGILKDTSIISCEGNQALNLALRPSFPDGNNGAGTSYTYVLAKDNFIVDLLSTPDLRNKAPGDYLIYGFAYDQANSNLLPLTNGTINLTDWINSYFNGIPNLCGDATLTSIKVKIKPVSPIQTFNEYICQGQPLVIQRDTILTPGLYSYSYINSYGCDSILTYDVKPVIFSITLTADANISCTHKISTISAISQSVPEGTDFHWFTENGNIVTGVNDTFITADFPGTYYLELEKNGCRDTFLFLLTQDNSLPNLTINNITLDCNQPIQRIPASSTTSGATFQWTGPSGFSSTEVSPEVDVAGIYYVTVTQSDGCFISRSIEVKSDFSTPVYSINTTNKLCSSDTLTISLSNYVQGTQFQWKLPNGTLSNSTSLQTVLNGIIELTVTGVNGCTSTQSFNIAPLYQNIQLIAKDSIINCSTPTILIPLALDQTPASLVVYGPNGYYTHRLDTIIDIPGSYSVEAVNAGGCKSYTSFNINSDFQYPRINIAPTVIGCTQDSIQLQATISPANARVSWDGPHKFHSTVPKAWVYEYGWYYVSVTLPNGCVTIDSVYVGLRNSNPQFSVNEDMLSCDKNSATLQLMINSPVNPTISWSGPNGFNSNQRTVNVTVPGIYWIKVIGSDGCFTKRSALVEDLTQKPIAQFVIDSITCLKKTATVILVNDQLYKEYLVFSPDNDTISNPNPFITALADTFTVHVVNIFGCAADTFFVTSPDTTLSTVTVNDFVLDCTARSKQLFVNSDSPVVSYKWFFPDGTVHIEANPVADISGRFSVITAGENGCETTNNFVISEDTLRPKVQIYDTAVSCRNTDLQLTYYTDVTNYAVGWFGPNGFSSSELNPVVSTPGRYYLYLTTPNGCTSNDSTDLKFRDHIPSLYVSDDTLNCSNPNLTIKVKTDAFKPQITWTDPNQNTYQIDSLQVNSPGIYYISLVDSNLCVVSDTFNILIDTLLPVSDLAQIFTINCTDTSLVIKAPTMKITSYEWSESNAGILSTEDSIIVNSAAFYALKLTGLNGCISIDTFRVNKDVRKPGLKATGGNIDCLNSKVELKAIANESNASYVWDIFGTSISDSVVFVDKPGDFTITVKGSNGCISDTSINVKYDTLSPELSSPNGSLTCDSSDYYLYTITSNPGGIYGWYGPNNFYSDLEQPRVVETGTYYLFYNAPNGCLTVDTILVDNNPKHPTISLNADTITCRNPAVAIYHTSDLAIEKWDWWSGNGFSSQDSIPFVPVGGYTYVNAYGKNGCSTLDSIFIQVDTIKPQSLFTFNDSIYCKHLDIKLFGTPEPRGENYTYHWITPDGEIISNEDKQDIWIRNIGTYQLQTTNERNGCIDYYQESISEKPNPLSKVEAEIQAATCIGVNNGSFLITGAPGAHGEMLYAVYDDYYTSNTFYNKLKPGKYPIRGEDTAGCTVLDTFFVPEASPINVSLGNDTLIDIGELINIKVIIDQANLNINSIIWNPDKCLNCTEFDDYPEETTVYSITITTDEGCIATASRRVIVKNNEYIFIPNVFTPNNDGKNDIVTIDLGTAVRRIVEMGIYDRWGNKVFGLKDINNGQSIIGWDGTLKGTPMNPGVFVYFLKYELQDGKVLVKKGDITLLR